MSRPTPATLSDLPPVIPLFPLEGAILLPRMKLPLTIFEPRYLAMTDDAMRGSRVIGMIQPLPSSSGARPQLHAIGGLGRITDWSLMEDGRMAIALQGLCRFRIVEELSVTTLYRQARVDCAPYAGDLDAPGDVGLDRSALAALVKRVLAQGNHDLDWQAFKAAPTDRLIDGLAMGLPLAPAEKQLLLETAGLEDRSRVLMALLDMAARETTAPKGPLQ